MSKNGIPLSDKELQAIKIYLEQRLGQYGVKAYKLKLEETPRLTYDYRLTQEIGLGDIGIFKFALKKIECYAEIWTLTKEENEIGQRHLVNVHLSYEHFNGGSNGCKCNIRLYTNDSGTVVEKYK